MWCLCAAHPCGETVGPFPDVWVKTSLAAVCFHTNSLVTAAASEWTDATNLFFYLYQYVCSSVCLRQHIVFVCGKIDHVIRVLSWWVYRDQMVLSSPNCAKHWASNQDVNQANWSIDCFQKKTARRAKKDLRRTLSKWCHITIHTMELGGMLQLRF